MSVCPLRHIFVAVSLVSLVPTAKLHLTLVKVINVSTGLRVFLGPPPLDVTTPVSVPTDTLALFVRISSTNVLTTTNVAMAALV